MIFRGRAPSIARLGYCSAARVMLSVSSCCWCTEFWAEEELGMTKSPLSPATVFLNSCRKGGGAEGGLLLNAYVTTFLIYTSISTDYKT